MAKTDVHEVFKYLQWFFSLTGMWPKPDSSLFYKIKGFVGFSLSLTFALLSLTEFYFTFNGIENVSYPLFFDLATLSYLPRVPLFFYNRHHFYRLLENLNHAVLKTYDDNFDFYIRKRIKLVTRLQLVFQGLIVATLVLTSILSFFNADIKGNLPMPLPFNLTHPPRALYGILWLLEMGILSYAALSNSSLDLISCSFMAIAAAHLEILREKLIRVAQIPFVGNNKNIEELYGRNNEEIIRKIKNCVQHHIAIEELVKSTEGTFSYIFLVQFLGSVIIICLTGFTFVLVPLASFQFGVSLLMFLTVTMQLSIYCGFGNDVMIQSLKIGQACYMSEWNNCPANVRKCLFIIMERSKRPFILTAGKFTPLTLSSFLLIIRSAFSYFSVLQKLYSKSSQDL